MDGKKGFSKRSGYQSFIAWEDAFGRIPYDMEKGVKVPFAGYH